MTNKVLIETFDDKRMMVINSVTPDHISDRMRPGFETTCKSGDYVRKVGQISSRSSKRINEDLRSSSQLDEQ